MRKKIFLLGNHPGPACYEEDRNSSGFKCDSFRKGGFAPAIIGENSNQHRYGRQEGYKVVLAERKSGQTVRKENAVNKSINALWAFILRWKKVIKSLGRKKTIEGHSRRLQRKNCP